MASRFARYVSRLVRTAVALAVLGLILALAQAAYHPFDALLAKGSALVADLDSKMSREVFNGITIGSLALILALSVFPIFLTRIDEKAYARGLWRGVSAVVVASISSGLLFGVLVKLG